MKDEIYISPGNRRMDIPTFSLPAEKTCNGTTHCKKFCYAKKAERAYPNVLPCRERNFNISKGNDFVRQVTKWIYRERPEYFRIHESGDFYSQAYVNKWKDIMTLCPDTTFLAYTQKYELRFPNMNNFVLYYSIWDDTKFNKVPLDRNYAFVMENKDKGIVYDKIIKYVVDEAKKCMKEKKKIGCQDCLWCFKNKGDVKFELH